MDGSPPPEENLVCRCFEVTEATIRQAIRERSLREVEEVTACTKAGDGCQSCWDDIKAILDDIHGTRTARREKDAADTLTVVQKRRLVARLLHQDLRPLLDLNDIQAEIVDVESDRAHIRFKGPMVGTANSSFLSLKRQIVRAMTNLCRRPMALVEVNVLEKHRPNLRSRS